jgi:3-hydroxybutyrate dehydrogenase
MGASPRDLARPSCFVVGRITGMMGTLYGAAYAATKHGLPGLTRMLALEVVRNDIIVNASCPALVRADG